VNKIILALLVTLTLTYAKDSINLKYADVDTQRKNPTSKDYILSYNNIIENVRTSLVNISTKKSIHNSQNKDNPRVRNPFFREFFKNQRQIPKDRIQRSLGSGVIISENGYIVTNNHVVKNADTIKVTIAGDKKEYEAKLIGKDVKSDLAIIKIEGKNLNAVTFFDSDKVKVGDITFALGNPFGLGETITQGIVSATGRSGMGIVEYENFIQTDASINPGNSGGALINSAGHLIGINSAIMSKSGGNVGIGFAIPSNMVTSIAKQLIEEGKYTRAYLGVHISDVSQEMSSFYNNQYGALITAVGENSPAFKAGLKRGDLIISVNAKQISSASELKNTIGSYQPSKIVSIKFLRNKKTDNIDVILGSLDKQVNTSELKYKGLSLKTLDTDIREKFHIPNSVHGLLVVDMKENKDLKGSAIVNGDIIIQVENIEINTVSDFKRASASDDKKRFYIYRKGNIFVTVL